MENFLIALNNSLPIFITIGLVLFLKYKKVIGENTSEGLKPIIFKIVVPFFTFSVLYKLSFNWGDLLIPLLLIGLNLILLVITILLGKSFKLKEGLIGSMALTMIAYAVGPIAYPFVQFNFSEEIFQKVIIFDMAIFINLMVFGPIIGAIFDPRSKVQVKDIVKALSTDIILLTILVTVVINSLGIEVPQSILSTAKYIGSPFSLLVIIFMTLNLKTPDLSRIKLLLLMTIGRVGFVFAGIFLIALILKPEDIVVKAMLLTMYTPFGNFPLIYAKKYNLDAAFISQISIFTTALIFLTYPLLIAVLL